MKENIKFFNTLLEADGYVIKDIPWVGYIKDVDQVLYCWDSRKIVIIQNNHSVIRDIVDVIFESLNDADGYIIETIPFSCYIKESQQLLECNLENCKIVVKNGVAVIKVIGDIIRYTATSKVTPVVPSSLPTIISNDFDPNTGQGVIKFATDVTSIGNLVFYSCTGLTSIEMPNSVTSIEGRAFYGCSGLTSVTIPNSVTSIGNEAFSGCSGLTLLTIGNSVTSIGNEAFYNCDSLTSVTIPNSVTSIGNEAFTSCNNLASVTIPNSVTSIGNRAFSGCVNLYSISYTGTISQYNSISKGSNWYFAIPATQVYCLGENPPAYTPI